jgi:large subunit ribosomal protein L25
MTIHRTTLQAKPREGSGKGSARRLRAQGLIPAVVYGRHLGAPAHIAVDPVAIKQAIATPSHLNTLITLKLDGAPQERQVLLKDVQLDPVSRQMVHADFLDVREDERVKVNVPLHLVGKPVGVLEGGILSQSRRQLEVWALPSAIPEKIEVDVSHLKMAQALHINDVKLPPGIDVKTTINFTVAVVAVPEKEEVVAPTPTAEEGAVAAPGEPGAEAKPGAAPGAAPAAGEAKAAPGAAAAAPAAKAAGKKEEGKKGEREDRKK